MQIEKLEFDAIRYNPELEAFEAAVRIHDSGHIFRYPVHLRAPLNAEYALIARGLTQKASLRHTQKHHDMRSSMPERAQGPAAAA
ncbi:MAG: hypothetical protein ACE369_15180 [Roseovarius sp.]